MDEHFYALIMAGGGGTRLWPLSRQAHPKQTLTLFGDRSMFQLAVDRLLPLLPLERIFVVTAAEQVAPLTEQVPGLPHENFIVEPQGRGTAPCIGLSALHLRARDPEAVMAVLTADHYIRDVVHFRAALDAARQVAQQGYLVTLGITPTYPATGYGYIARDELLGETAELAYYRVARFTEKPDEKTALQLFWQGTYAWNSGMFIWRANRVLEEIARWMPPLYETLMTLDGTLGTPGYEEQLMQLWPAVHKETIDYGVMEKAEQVAVIPVDLGWSDVGAWPAVMDLYEPDGEGNVLVGDVVALDTNETMVFSQDHRLVSTIGLHDMIVVDTPGALLIATRDQAERVREVVDRLKAQQREDVL